jgi:hypothetical protein
MERPETKEKFPVKYSMKPGVKPEMLVIDVEGKGATVIAIKATDIIKRMDKAAQVKVRNERKLKEFTPNPAETPEIYYGNEKRRYFKQPSFDNQDMNAIKSTHPIEEEACTECGEEMIDGQCSQCGDVWGKPDSGHQATMARAELKDLISNASKLYSMVEPGTELPGWVAAYITLASDYMHSVAEYASEVA